MSNLWAQPNTYKEDAGRIQDDGSDYNYIDKQTDMEVRVDRLKIFSGRISPWKAAGPDGVHGYWVRSFRSLHRNIVNQMNDTIMKRNPSSWMTTGRTVLIPKGPKQS